jgi:hypothetical protein
MKKLSILVNSSLIFVIFSRSVTAIMSDGLIPRDVLAVFDWFFNVLPLGGDRFIFFKFLIFLLFFSIIQEVMRRIPPFKSS